MKIDKSEYPASFTRMIWASFIWSMVGSILVTVVFLGFCYLSVQIQGKERIVEGSIPNYEVAIVFGAGLSSKGVPSPVLADRVGRAVELYQNGQIKMILMSGDNRFVEYNEPEAMRRLATSLGVPEADIVLDYAGRRTYDTCYRAREIFGLKRAILVTNQFHLPRALFTCSQLGVQAVGVSSDNSNYGDETSWKMREVAASIVAWVQVNVTHPEPILGPKETIIVD